MLNLLAGVISVLLSIAWCWVPADAQTAGARARAKANEWTIGLAAGLPEDTSLPFAAEIARNLNESGTLRVLPLATPGAASSVKDLMFLDGIDVALTQTDVLQYLRNVEKIPQVERRVQYIAALYHSEVHLVVRNDVKGISDLAGKKVGFNVAGAGPTVTAALIFQRLNVKVEPVYVPNAQALAMIRSGELAGFVHSAAKPNSFIGGIGKDAGVKLLPIPYEPLDELYVPSQFSATDYPNLVRPGQFVDTVAVQTVLAALDRSPNADRGRRVRRFVELFFERFDRFKGLGYQPAWRDVNLSAQISGWTRHELAAERLAAELRKVRGNERAEPRAVMDATEQERQFKLFLEWQRQQAQQKR